MGPSVTHCDQVITPPDRSPASHSQHGFHFSLLLNLSSRDGPSGMAPQRRAVSHEPQPAMADTTTSRCSTMSNCSSVSKHASMSSYHTPLSGTPSGSTAGPTSPSPHTSSAWYEDRWNLFLLVTLYTIQGLPSTCLNLFHQSAWSACS